VTAQNEVEIRADERGRVLTEIARRVLARARDRETAAALADVDGDIVMAGQYRTEAKALRALANRFSADRLGTPNKCGHIASWRAAEGLCAHPDCRRASAAPALDELLRRLVDLLPTRANMRLAEGIRDLMLDAWALGQGAPANRNDTLPSAPAVTVQEG
jgi:hypothetical protein